MGQVACKTTDAGGQQRFSIPKLKRKSSSLKAADDVTPPFDLKLAYLSLDHLTGSVLGNRIIDVLSKEVYSVSSPNPSNDELWENFVNIFSERNRHSIFRILINICQIETPQSETYVTSTELSEVVSWLLYDDDEGPLSNVDPSKVERSKKAAFEAILKEILSFGTDGKLDLVQFQAWITSFTSESNVLLRKSSLVSDELSPNDSVVV